MGRRRRCESSMPGRRMSWGPLLALLIATVAVMNADGEATLATDEVVKLPNHEDELSRLQAQGDALLEALRAMSKLHIDPTMRLGEAQKDPVDPKASKEELQAREKVVKKKLKDLAKTPAFKDKIKKLQKKEKDGGDDAADEAAEEAGAEDAAAVSKEAVSDADDKAKAAEDKKEEIKEKEESGEISAEEAKKEEKEADTEMAKAKVTKAQVLRSQARAQLEAKGLPIPDKLKPGQFAKKVTDKMPEAVSADGKKVEEKAVKAKIAKLPDDLQKASIPELKQ